jgi:RNA polymerase sigma factor (sigma-70 family)
LGICADTLDVTIKTQPDLVQRRMLACADLPRQASWRHVGGWPADVGREDLEQIARITLMEFARSADPHLDGDDFVRMARTAINRDLIDYRRHIFGKDGRRGASAMTDPLPATFAQTPAAEQASYEDVDAIRRVFKRLRLTPQQQKAVGYLFQDMSITEIAQTMGVSATHVHHLIRAVRAKVEPHLHRL